MNCSAWAHSNETQAKPFAERLLFITRTTTMAPTDGSGDTAATHHPGAPARYDPVIAPNGVSYERRWIEAHLERGGKDPVTFEPLRLDQLRPNLQLKDAIDTFLDEHPVCGGP